MMVIHVVSSGDTINSIANKYGADASVISEENKIPSNTILVPGQTVVVTQANITPKKGAIEVSGYTYPFFSLDLIDESMPYLTNLKIFSYQVSPDGSLLDIDDASIISQCSKYSVAPYMVITNIDGEGYFSPDVANGIFTSQAATDTLINNVIETMKSKGYEGLDIDFEYLNPDDVTLYNSFLSQITKAMHDEGYEVSTALGAKNKDETTGIFAAHDYAYHGKTADRVLLMTYEWGYAYSQPMAVAPLPQIIDVMEYAVKEMPSDKILMGIPNYGYNWSAPYNGSTPAVAVGNYEAVTLAQKYGATINYDETQQSPNFTYIDESGTEHTVWFEDARSIEAKLTLPYNYNLAGIGYWTVDKTFPQNWLVLNNTYDIIKNNN